MHRGGSKSPPLEIPGEATRAFIAIEIPETIRNALAAEQARLRRVCPEASWTRPEGIHLTLKFLGEVADNRLPEIEKALAQTAPVRAFTISAKGLGFFPDGRRPRVLWAGINAPPALSDLATRVSDITESLGFPAESRKFSPHLTLARFRVSRPQPELLAAVAERRDEVFGAFEASQFFLWESKLGAGGAKYRKIAAYPA